MPKKPIYRYLRYLWRNRIGFCNICRKPTAFLHTQSRDTLRDDLECLFCRSISRNRHLAKCVVNLFSAKGVNTLRDLDAQSGLNVYIAAASGSIVKALGDFDNVTTSEYHEGYESGSTKDGVLCQNIENLSFDDDLFDLVITEDVFEHVQNYSKGFEEVQRTLKNEGVFIFTVPFYFDRKTQDLFRSVDGEFVPVVTPVEYHGDSIRGKIPAFYRFGWDVFNLLAETGFETEVIFSKFRDTKWLRIYDCYTFIARKKT